MRQSSITLPVKTSLLVIVTREITIDRSYNIHLFTTTISSGEYCLIFIEFAKNSGIYWFSRKTDLNA